MPGYATDPPPFAARSAGIIDRAETFAESDVTVTNTRTEVSNESVGIGSTTTTASIPDNLADDSASGSGEAGLKVNPNVDVLEVKLTTVYNDGTFGALGTPPDELAVIRDSDDTVLTSEATAYADNSQFTVNVSLSAGTTYRLVWRRSDGSAFDIYEADASNPHTSAFGDLTDSVTLGSFSRTSIAQVTFGPQADGNAVVEWPMPADVYRWDAAHFDTAGDGTAEVYVEEDQAGGWTEVAGPISSGDSIPANPSNNVRLRVDLSRTLTSQDPRLTECYRRRVIP